MHLVPSELPEPRLISSLASDAGEKTPSDEESDSPFQLGGSRLFTGNGRAIFVGLFVGAIAICIAGSIYHRRHRLAEDEIHVPTVLPAITESVLGSTHSNSTPLPMLVQV